MDDRNVMKIWGTRQRMLLTNQSEIDILFVKTDHFCSLHKHKNKINRFWVVEGKVRIDTERGNIVLTKGMSWDVRPPLKHRFFALEDSMMIELAFVEEGEIDPNDIDRESQGGKLIKGIEYTEFELRKKGWLNL